jgi:hypothetical protein
MQISFEKGIQVNEVVAKSMSGMAILLLNIALMLATAVGFFCLWPVFCISQ